MKHLILALPLFALAACGEEPAAEPAPAETAAAPAEPSLPAPDEELFTELFAATCPAAEEAVSTAVCRRAMGAETVACEFGVGEDTALRHDATLVADDGEWTISDAEALCAEHGSHHVDS